MDPNIVVKKENLVLDDIVSQNEAEFFVTVERNSDVTIKTKIKSETPSTRHLARQIKTKTVKDNLVSNDIVLQNEACFVTMKRNSDDVTIKTEIKSETPFTEHLVLQIKTETITCSNNKDINSRTEIDKGTLISDVGSQDEAEFVPDNSTSSVCDDNKDEELSPVKSLRLCKGAVSGADRDKSPLFPAEVSVRDTNFCNGKHNFECECQKSDISDMPTAEHVLSQSCSERGANDIRPLHLQLKSLIQKLYLCNICGKNFSYLSQFKAHSLIHEGEKPHQSKLRSLIQKLYLCNICGKDFSDLPHFKAHSLIHEGEKPHQSKLRSLIQKLYLCNICGKDFSDLPHFKAHSLIHEGEKPHQSKLKSLIQKLYLCNICGKNFSYLSHFKAHSLIHEGKKPHQSKTCDKRFTQSSSLKKHNLIHDGKKPHQCKTCGKSFTRSSGLKNHNLIHEGKKPYQCKTCGKSFTQLSTLKTHHWIHEAKKPYQCKTCGKSFARSSSLKKHNFIHEGKK